MVRRGGERWRRHWAWGEVVFTGRRGGDVDGGGSLGRVGKDCVTGLLLSSDMGEVEARGGNIPPQARAEAHSIWPRRR